MGVLNNFKMQQAFEAMLTFATWQDRFTESDREAMKEGLNIIRTAMVQPFGATSDAKRRDKRCVTDAEFDRAVMQVICSAMVMWLSGVLDKVEVANDDKEGKDRLSVVRIPGA